MESPSPDVTIKQGEAKTMVFRITNSGVAQDVSAAVLTFTVKRSKRDTTSVFEKADGDFNKTDASIGVVSVPLSATDTNQTPGGYTGELRTVFAVDNVDKSEDVFIEIERAVKAA